MLAEARRAHHELRFDEGDAEALPCPDNSFDAVVSNFGVHHIARPDRAIAEALRVLRAGGRFAFTTWAEPADNIAWRLLFDAIRAHGDPLAANAPPSGGNLGTVEAALRLLDDAGVTGCRAETVRREWLVAEPRDIVVALARGTVRTAALIAAQPAAARPAIEAAVAAAGALYRSGSGFAVPIAAILASGVKPAA
jgi:SAM-dependent methyltransferase